MLEDINIDELTANTIEEVKIANGSRAIDIKTSLYFAEGRWLLSSEGMDITLMVKTAELPIIVKAAVTRQTMKEEQETVDSKVLKVIREEIVGIKTEVIGIIKNIDTNVSTFLKSKDLPG